MLKGIVRLSIAAFALVASVNLYGAAIDQETAVLFAQNWLASEGNPLAADGTAREVGSAVAVTEGDRVLAYGVSFQPKGFVVISADDRINPLISYGLDGAFADDAASPMHALLVMDLSARLERADAEAPEGKTRGGDLPEYYQGNRSQWEKYLSRKTRAHGTYALNDIRVPYLVKTWWSQTGAGNVSTYYNYYTPTITKDGKVSFTPGDENNVCTGCANTAIAQLMRYYEWPQAGVGKQSDTVTVGYSNIAFLPPRSYTIALRGGDDNGGPYEWKKMLYNPGLNSTDVNYEETTEENAKATGRLMADVGAINGCSYYINEGGETGASPDVPDIINKMGYLYVASSEANGLLGELADLDARRPFYLSWSNVISDPDDPSGGHAFLADGYGYMDNRLYIHLNLGWGYFNGGNSNAWYNVDEYVNSGDGLNIINNWSGPHNFYRQYLQKNESKTGRIISGRVTDANGLPLAGVKASIRKKLDDGTVEEDTFLTMLVWNEPVEVDGETIDPYAQLGSRSQTVGADDLANAPNGILKGFGPQYYRNCTDAQGIWAIDKVAAGTYEIVLEKEGYVFLGTKEITVKKNANVWGNNFVAVPESIGALELENWWIAEGKAYLQFNRNLGDVRVDASQISIGGQALTGLALDFNANSNLVVVDLNGGDFTGALAMTAKAIYYDFNPVDTGVKTNRQPDVYIVDAIDEKESEQGTYSCPVSAITRDGNGMTVAANTLTWKVEAENLTGISSADFEFAIMDTYQGSDVPDGSVLPSVSLESWDSESGILTANVSTGIAYVRADYVPANGDAYLAGQVYYVNNENPKLLTANLNKTAQEDTYITVTFNKAVGEPAVSSLKGAKVSNDGQTYCYTGSFGGEDFVMWKKVGSQEAVYAATDEMIIGEAPAENTPGTFLLAEEVCYYINLDANASLSQGDFIWKGSDPNWYREGEPSGILLSGSVDKLSWRPGAQEKDFYVTLNNNGGNVAKVNVTKVTDSNGKALTGPSAVMRLYLQVTLQNAETLEKSVDYSVTGCETIEVKPYADALCDECDNMLTEGCTTGELPIYGQDGVSVISYGIAPDNGSVGIRFNKRILGNNKKLTGNLRHLQETVKEDLLHEKYESFDLTTANVSALVQYDDGETADLSLDGGTDDCPVIRHKTDTSYLLLDFFAAGNISNNLKLVDPVYQKKVNNREPKYVIVSFKNIYDEDGYPLLNGSITIPLMNQLPDNTSNEFTRFTQGYQRSLLPPVFTNAKNAYTFCAAHRGKDGLCDLVNTASTPVIITDNIGGAYENYGMIQDAEGKWIIDPTKDIEDGIYVCDEMEDGLEYYGVYYRDLDSDGRIDAIDLNFHNPYAPEVRPAELAVGSSALSAFAVYQQREIDDTLSSQLRKTPIYAKDEYDWSVFPTWDDYPLYSIKGWSENGDEQIRFYETYRRGKESVEQWFTVPVTDVAVVEQNVRLYDNDSTGYSGVVSVLRLTLDQTQVVPRTNGDRGFKVLYTAPKAYTYSGSNTYNTYHADGNEATPATEANGLSTEDVQGIYDSSDEKAGIYWVRTASSADGSGKLDSIWVCDSFGPVMAWDGAPALAISAVAWRSTPFPKYSEKSALDAGDSLENYEFLDVRFSEPVAFIDDFAMDSVGYFGHNGFRGVELIDEYTARFSYIIPAVVESVATNVNVGDGSQTPGHAGTEYSFSGALFSEAVPLDHVTSSSAIYPENANFAGNATGIHPVISNYLVTGGTDDMIPVLKVVNRQATVTNYDGTTLETIASETSSLSGSSTVAFVSNGGNFNKKEQTIALDSTDDIWYVSANDNVTIPGAGYYVGINSLFIQNTSIQGQTLGVTLEGNVGLLNYKYDFEAPAPNEAVPSMNSTASTPANMVMSGPIYNYVKANAADQATNTSRINRGQNVSTVGIDVAAPSNYRLTAVKVRVVDTSWGHFDPATDLKPLADDDDSGVYLLDNSTDAVVKISANGLDWSAWKTNEAGLPYREVTLKPLGGVTVPTTGGALRSSDFAVCVVPSDAFNLGASFYVEIPDDGITLGTYTTADALTNAWATANGTKGSAFTSGMYKDLNGDLRWAYGEGFVYSDDVSGYRAPVWDGGRTANVNALAGSRYLLHSDGVNTRNVYYAKKNGNLNADTSQVIGYARTNTDYYTNNNSKDLDYNVDYEPGDDLWYDIGGTLGVYDEGIDLPITGRADKFPLPYATQQAGARSAQMRAAASTAASSVTSGNISAPSGEPVAVLGLNMEDASRGFGPRYVMGGSILVEAISKSIAAGSYTLAYVANGETLSFANGEAVVAPQAIGERAILLAENGYDFVVVRRMADIYDEDKDDILDEPVALPTADTTTDITIATDSGRDICQPQAITGVRVMGVGAGVALGDKTLTRNGLALAWDGGAEVNVESAGIYVLPGKSGKLTDYIMVQTTLVGGASQETLPVYTADAPEITPFQNITGLEIMAVGDMLESGWHTFSYDGTGSVSFGNGGATAVPANEGELVIVYGDAVSSVYSRPFVVIRRTSGKLPNVAVTDRLYSSQTSLLKAVVTLISSSGVTPSHFAPLSNDSESGISLWWDADGSGVYSTGDMFVPLAETPVLAGAGDSWTCTMTPDPAFLTAWLASAADASATNNNFFVCVRTTEDMSFGDKFYVRASFYDATENDYAENKYNGANISFVSATSSLITCTSVTNTVFSSLTSANQTIDSGEMLPLFAIAHWGEANGTMPWVTKVSFSLTGKANFAPETALCAMDGEAASRGVLLYRDSNGNGVWDSSDTVVNSTLKVVEDGDTFKYTFLIADESCTVPVSNSLPQLFIVAHTNDALPYGVKFYGTMEADAISYNTGDGYAASAVNTDILTSTINSVYADVVGFQPYSKTGGLLIQSAGANVSGYQKVTLTKALNGNYILSWNDYKAAIENPLMPVTVVLGSGDNSITVTYNPEQYFKEDTLIYGEHGKPAVYKEVELEGGGTTEMDVLVPMNSVLKSLAGSKTCYYVDIDGDGAYTSACDTITENPEGAVSFKASDNLAFFDANGDNDWNSDEPIFVDTDRVYNLPWADIVLDRDSINSSGIGKNAVILNALKELETIAEAQSPAEGEDTEAGLTYLYYVDMDENPNRNYAPLTDVIVARSGDGAPAELVWRTDDCIVLDPAVDAGEESFVPEVGVTKLRAFTEGDYLKMNATTVEAEQGLYTQNKKLMLSEDNAWQDATCEWEFLVTPSRTIRAYNPESGSPDFADYKSAMTAIVGLDFANSGATDVYLSSVKVRFYSESNFAQEDLAALTADETSGVQLWKDADGNGIFDPYVDQLLPLASAPVWSQNAESYILTLAPKSGNLIKSENVDNIYDFFVVVIPSNTANNGQLVDDGDKFHATILSSDIALTKTARQTSNLTSGTITIDSKPPVVQSIVSSSTDGRLVDTLVLTFDEEMKRLEAMDLKVWTVTDIATGNDYVVTGFELSDDTLACTLTLGAAEGKTVADYTTGPVAVSAEFPRESALVDWAGNPTEIQAYEGTDSTKPVVTKVTFLDTTMTGMDGTIVAGTDGHVDKLFVEFSEAVIDTTYASSGWTLDGVELTKVDSGSTVLGIQDALNDSYFVFTVNEPSENLDDIETAVLGFGQNTLVDKAKNLVNTEYVPEFVDKMKVVLLSVVPDGEKAYQEDDESWTLPAGAKIKMTLAKSVKASEGELAAISGIQLVGGGKTYDLTTANGAFECGEKTLLFTLNEDFTGFSTTQGWEIVVLEENTGFEDKYGNRLADVAVSFKPAVPPVIKTPVENALYDFETETIAPKLNLNDAFDATAWTVEVFAADTDGKPVGEALATASGTNEDISKIDAAVSAESVELTGWYVAGTRYYVLKATLVATETFEVEAPFYALREDDVFEAVEGEAVTLERTGAATSCQYQIFDKDETHLFLLDGAYTSGTATVDTSLFEGQLIPGTTMELTVVAGTVINESSTETTLAWSDETEATKLAADDTLVATVTYSAVNVNGEKVTVASGKSFTYTISTDFDDIFAKFYLADSAYNELSVMPIVWNDATTLYAKLEKKHVAAYQWRIVPSEETEQLWSLSGEMEKGRTRFGWTVLANGNVLVAGGYAGNLSGMDSAEVYNAETGLWSSTAALAEEAYDNTLVALADGTALSLGGMNQDGKLGDIELYDGAAWSVIGQLTEKKSMVSALRNGDKIYVVGGCKANTKYVNTVEVITVTGSTAESTAVASLNAARGGASLFLQNGRLVVVGGKDANGAVAGAEAIDVDQDGNLGSAWTELSGLPAIANASYVQDGNGAIWSIGGKDTTNTYSLAADADLWQAGPALANAHEYGAAVLLDDVILVAGGKDTATTEILEYAAEEPEWKEGTSLATADTGCRKLFALTECNGSAFAFGGQIAGAYTTVTERRLAGWSKWIDADENANATEICITGLNLEKELGYNLEVRAKNPADELSEIYSSEIFEIRDATGERPVATLTAKVDGEPMESGACTLSKTIEFTFTPDENTSSYRYIVDGKTSTTAKTTVTLDNLAAGAHSISLYGVAATGLVQETPATFQWIVMGTSVTSEQVDADDATVLTDDLLFTVAGESCTLYRYALDSSTMPTTEGIPLDTQIELDALATGAHTLYVWTTASAETWNAANYTEFAFNVIAATVAPAESADVTTERTLTIGCEGGTLAKYQWTLDDGEPEVVSPAASELVISGLALGSHTVKIAAIDEKGNVQAKPAEAYLVVNSAVNDRLLAVLSADVTTAVAGEDITFTLEFTNNAGNAVTATVEPKADDFVVENGAVSGIVKKEENSYTVSVTPNAVAPGASEMVSLTLPETKAYDENGHGNVASETAKILVYGSDTPETAKLVSFGMKFFSDEECTQEITSVALFRNFYAQVVVTAAQPVTSADFVLTYDTTKFAMAEEGFTPAALVQEPYNKNIGESPNEKSLAVGEIIEVGEFRLGGAVMDEESAKSGEFVLAKVKFNALLKGDAADTDFVLSAGTSQIGLAGMKPLDNEDEAIGYAAVPFEVTESVANIGIAATPGALTEGEQVTLSVFLDECEPIEADLTIVVKSSREDIADQTFVIAEGQTEPEEPVVLTIADDCKIAGDYDVTFTVDSVTASNPAVTTPAAGSSATVNVTDKFSTVTISLDETEVDEGGSLNLKATLDKAVDTDLTIHVATDKAYGTVTEQTLTITAGETEAEVAVQVGNDQQFSFDYDVVFSVDEITPAETGVIATPATGASATFTVKDTAVGNFSFELVDADGNPLTEIKEGDAFYVKANLADNTVAQEVKFALEFGGDAAKGIDYTYEDNFVIVANDSTGTETITTYVDGIVKGASKQFSVKVVSMTLGGVEYTGFTESDEMSLDILDIDKYRADISGDGSVGIQDASVFASKYQTEDDGSPEWAACDFNADSVIDITDVSLFVYYYTSKEVKKTRAVVESPVFTFTLESEDDLEIVGVGDEIEVKLCVECTRAFSVAYADVTWDPEFLEVVAPLTEDGTLDLDEATNTAVFGKTFESGTLDAERGIVEEFGAGKLGESFTEKQWIGKLIFRVKKKGEIQINVDNAGGSGSGFCLENDTADAEYEGLSFESEDKFSYKNLKSGWNLLGAPFDLDEEALAALKGETGVIALLDADTNAFVAFQGTALEAGQGFWLYLDDAPAVAVNVYGDASEKPGVDVQPGWNLVTPLLDTAEAEMVLPENAEVWTWTEDGYRAVVEDSQIEIGAGYWLKVKEANTLWKTK